MSASGLPLLAVLSTVSSIHTARRAGFASVIGKGEPACSLVFVLVCGSSGLRASHQQCPLNLFSPWPLSRTDSGPLTLNRHGTSVLQRERAATPAKLRFNEK